MNCNCGNMLSGHQESDMCDSCYWKMRAGLFTCTKCHVFYCKQEEHDKIKRHIQEHDKDTFNAIVISKSDFSDNYELSKTELEFVWNYAPDKLTDFLMQDYDLCMDSYVDYALEAYAKELTEDD